MNEILKENGFEKTIEETTWIKGTWTIRITNEGVLEAFNAETDTTPKYFIGTVDELEEVLDDIK